LYDVENYLKMKRSYQSRGTKQASDRFRPIAIDLFSGSGGLTLGLKKAGFKVIAGVELDSLSVESYRKNHRDVYLWEEDIRGIDLEVFKAKLGIQVGELHLLAGCPPCQGFSTIRTHKKGTAVQDPRNGLVAEFIRFVAGLLPKAIMLENVPGLASYDGFTEVVARLKALGYSCEYEVFDAASYGIPQRRKRLVLVGSRHGLIPLAKATKTVRHVRDAINSLPAAGRSGDVLHDVAERRSKRIAALIGLVPKDGGSRSTLPASYQLACHKACPGFRDVYGRMAWDEVSPTITSGCTNPSKGRFIHPEQNRAITPREAALLQGFPPKYFFSMKCGKDGAARLIGNAFPPEFARRFAAEIYKVLRVEA
jgi:DNA (cytosine-5)-methyltransferase 1